MSRCHAAMSVAAAIALLAGSPADARRGRTDAVTFTGTVPQNCSASLAVVAVPLSKGTIDLGTLTERCNAARGYAVFLEYSPGLAGATVVVDGRAVMLRDAGPVVLTQTRAPGERSRPILMRLPFTAGGTLSVRIAPL